MVGCDNCHVNYDGYIAHDIGLEFKEFNKKKSFGKNQERFITIKELVKLVSELKDKVNDLEDENKRLSEDLKEVRQFVDLDY